MTVDIDTSIGGEIVMSRVDAKQITEQIRAGITEVEKLKNLIIRAYTERAWSAMGYATWQEYCRTELPALIRLDWGDIIELRSAGMSTRGIASVTGISQPTISRHTRPQRTGDANESPVTGLDGKTYTTERREPRRPNLSAAPIITRPLGCATDELKRLQKDDRYGHNKERIVSELRPYARDLVTELHKVEPALINPPIFPENPSNTRPGVTRYSKDIQQVSASLAEASLTDLEVAEALGAAQFLYEMLRGERIIRENAGVAE